VTSPTRRDVIRLGLVAAAGAALAGCTRGSDGTPGPTAPGGPEDPDRALRAEIGAQETALSGLYASAVEVLPAAQAASVTRLGERHEAYRQAIDPDGLATQSPNGTASATGSTSGSPSPSASPAPTAARPSTPAAAIEALRKAEQRAASTRITQSVRAVDAELARLIVLAGAGAAGAAEVLAGGGP
jgi:hypothetical protein